MRKLLFGVAAALIVTGCTNSQVETVTSTTTTVASTSTSTSTTTSTSTSTTAPLEHVTVYYLLDDVGEVNRPGPTLVPVDRLDEDGGLAGALDEVLKLPSVDEQSAVPAMSSAIPVGTELLGVSVSDGVATVDLSPEFEGGGGSFSVLARLAQVVYTATRFGDVDAVLLEIAGEPVTLFSSEGLELEGPQTRDDYQDFIPMIFVDEPTSGGTLGNPAHLVGEAAVFEAVFQAAITNGEGLIIAQPPYLMTTNGVGWGTFDETIAYDVDIAQWGSLIVWEDSARDGSQINVREYPVWLTPAGS